MVLSSFCKSEVLIDSESPLISRTKRKQSGRTVSHLFNQQVYWVCVEFQALC